MDIIEIEMTIWGRKFTHPVAVVEDLNDNILGIDFMHQHKMNYATSKQITFVHMLTNALYVVYNKTSSLVQIKFITEDSKWFNYKY